MPSSMSSMNLPSRREFLTYGAAATLAASTLPGSLLARAQQSPQAKKRRLLFNWDGSVIHCWGKTVLKQQGDPNWDQPLTREQFTRLVFTPVENTPIDTLCFSFGSGNIAEYQSNVLEWPGEADRFVFPESRTWHGGVEVDPKDQYTNPKALADAGHNPPAVIVEECRQRGIEAFVSLRMNDCHDGQHPPGTLPNPEYPTFKRQNPDWLVDDLDWWSALNFAHPRVRALKLRVIEEFFDRWDFDGIELDWLRHTLYFPRGTETDNGQHLTTFMRTVRHSLNERAKRRGRPITLAVRVPERVAWCNLGGFEIGKWIEEDLADVYILGQGLVDHPHLDEFRRLMTRGDRPIYGSLYAYGNGYRLSPPEVIRGNAANLWRDGVDGLYTFNWIFHGDWRRDLLREISSPDSLAAKSKHYSVLKRLYIAPGDRGGDYIRYNGMFRDAPVPFRITEALGTKEVLLPVAEDLADLRPKKVELWVGTEYLRDGDELEISLNGRQLSPPAVNATHTESVGYPVEIPSGNGLVGFPPMESIDTEFPALRFEVDPSIVRLGRNSVTFLLKKRAAEIEHELQVTRVELATVF